MNIILKPISLNDDKEGLKVLKKIVNDDESNVESPVPSYIDEDLYLGFLKLSEDEAKDDQNPCIRFWVMDDDKKIGYADIKKTNEKEVELMVGNIGLILLKEYRKQGIGMKTFRLLIEKAKNDLKIEKVLITTCKDNESVKKLCKKLNAVEYNFNDNKSHYYL